MTVSNVPNPHLKLEHFIDVLVLEARWNSDHVHNARKQLEDFIAKQYIRRSKEVNCDDIGSAG